MVANFADGIWGQNTETTILSYKFTFRLRFPPGSSTSILDGFAGPRTMALLDMHIVAFDAAVSAIDARIAELLGSGMVITELSRTGLLTRTRITLRRVTVDGVNAALFHHPNFGAFLVRTPILETYTDRFHVFGAPLDDEHDGPDGTREVNFQSGQIQAEPSTGAVFTGGQSDPDLVF